MATSQSSQPIQYAIRLRNDVLLAEKVDQPIRALLVCETIMGIRASQVLTSVYERFQRWRGKDLRILLLGLDAVGKTTLLYRLKLHESVTTIPTIGFNVETFQHGKLTFTAWDVGGGCGIRPLWRHYYERTRAIVFLVDSHDRQRLGEAKEALHMLYSSEMLHQVPLLVLASKQDLDEVMSVHEIRVGLELEAIKTPAYYVQGTVITTGEGVDIGFDWLEQQLASRV